MKHPVPDLVGKRYSRLTVIERSANKGGRAFWRCLCDCGKETIVGTASLNSGNTTSCGCYHRECVSKCGKARTTHGKTNTRLYGVWHGMRKRCYGKTNEHYDAYGARGIGICAEWQDFSQFENWATKTGYADGLTIDRINNNGDYAPDNCRWATAKQQARNRRDTIHYKVGEETKPLIEWAEMYGLNKATVYDRYNKGTNPLRNVEG